MKFKTKSSEETKRAAFDLAKKIPRGTVLCLYGDLGAGKTTFTQGLAEYFGIKRIISPTFVLIREYQIKINFPCHSRSNRESIQIIDMDPRVKHEDDRGRFTLKRFYHIDLYRLDNVEEVKNLGIEEIMADKNNLVIIEWADKLKELMPKNRIDIYFKYVSDEEREISMSLRGASKTSDVAI